VGPKVEIPAGRERRGRRRKKEGRRGERVSLGTRPSKQRRKEKQRQLTFSEDTLNSIYERLLGSRDTEVDLFHETKEIRSAPLPAEGRQKTTQAHLSRTDLLLLCERKDSLELGSPGDLDVGDLSSHRSGSSVSRRDEDLLDQGRLSELPGKSVLSTSSAEKQDTVGERTRASQLRARGERTETGLTYVSFS